MKPGIDARGYAHLTAEYVATWTEEESDRWDDLISRAFYAGGDPRQWEHFADLSEEMQRNLTFAFEGWTEARLLQDAIGGASDQPTPQKPLSANKPPTFAPYVGTVADDDPNVVSVEELVARCAKTFPIYGDPRRWPGFNELPEPMKALLRQSYESWTKLYPVQFGFGEDIPIH